MLTHRYSYSRVDCLEYGFRAARKTSISYLEYSYLKWFQWYTLNEENNAAVDTTCLLDKRCWYVTVLDDP